MVRVNTWVWQVNRPQPRGAAGFQVLGSRARFAPIPERLTTFGVTVAAGFVPVKAMVSVPVTGVVDAAFGENTRLMVQEAPTASPAFPEAGQLPAPP